MDDSELEKLRKLIEENADKPEIDLSPEEQFINEKMKPHPKEKVTYEVIYRAYLLWCAERYIKPKSLRELFKQTKKRFRKYIDSGAISLYIEKAPFPITKEELQEYRRDKRKYERRVEVWRKRKEKEKLKRKEERLKKQEARKAFYEKINQKKEET